VSLKSRSHLSSASSFSLEIRFFSLHQFQDSFWCPRHDRSQVAMLRFRNRTPFPKNRKIGTEPLWRTVHSGPLCESSAAELKIKSSLPAIAKSNTSSSSSWSSRARAICPHRTEVVTFFSCAVSLAAAPHCNNRAFHLSPPLRSLPDLGLGRYSCTNLYDIVWDAQRNPARGPTAGQSRRRDRPNRANRANRAEPWRKVGG